MLTLKRRHSRACLVRDENELEKCGCPIRVYGTLPGHNRPIREALGTSDIRLAYRKLEQLEQNPTAAGQRRSVRACIEKYLEDCRSRKIKDSTITSYKVILAHLERYCDGHRAGNISDIDIELLTEFRNARQVSLKSMRKEISNIRAFFAFCVRQKWLEENPAKAVKMPKEPRDFSSQTRPLSRDERQALLAACDKITNNHTSSAARARLRAKALVQTLLYTGLRISDVAKLERAKVNFKTGRCITGMRKIDGTLVVLSLRKPCLDALRALPVESAEHFFWSGSSDLDTCVKSLRRTVYCLARLAGIENIHPHRFRDTFSVELLAAGESIETVSAMLGHSSVAITERYYRPWVEAFQQKIDTAAAKLDEAYA